MNPSITSHLLLANGIASIAFHDAGLPSDGKTDERQDGSVSSPIGVLDEFYILLGCSKKRFDESAGDRLDYRCRCLRFFVLCRTLVGTQVRI